MMRRKKILIVDVPETCYWLSENIKRWGYEPIEAPDSTKDSVSEMILREKIDLLIVAQEFTFKGPSRSNDWKKGDDIEVDYEFGVGALSCLRLQKNNLPVILLTTDTLKENKWIRNDQGKLDWIMLMKNKMGDEKDVYSDLKKAIEEFLGPGLSIHEWARVFIVDDEIEICLNMKDMFGFEGYNADYATTAKEAFQKIDSNCYDLLLCDIKLEGRASGIDIIKNFRENEKRPKIIVISAIPRDALNPSFQKEGIMHLIDGYLDKPSCSSPEKLMRMVARVMEREAE